MQQNRTGRRISGTPAAAIAAWLAFSGIVSAEEPLSTPKSAPEPASSTLPQPAGAPIGMDRLLSLPRGYDVGSAKKGGATRAEWRARFVEARAALAASQAALAKTRAEMEANAADSGSWKMAPPGADLANTESPSSFRLTQQLRRGREEVKQAELALTALDVEANIASVPQDWRE